MASDIPTAPRSGLRRVVTGHRGDGIAAVKHDDVVPSFEVCNRIWANVRPRRSSQLRRLAVGFLARELGTSGRLALYR